MKVRSIIIKNYKILENLELHFTDLNGRTLDTIVLAGDNGCGKTTVLNLINRALSPIPFPVPFCKELRMVISFTEDQKELIISSLTGLEGTELLEKSGIRVSEFISRFENRKNVELVYSEIQKEGKTEVEKNDFNLFVLLQKASAYSHMNGLKLLYTNKEVDHKFNSLSTEPDLKHNIYSFYSSILTESESKESRILKKLKELESSFGIQSHPEKIDENMVFKNMYKETVDIEDLSSGEKQILFRFFYLHSSGIKDSIVMVDEPENSLHPKWQQKIVNLYRRLGPKNQVIFATHSPHIISSLKPVNLFLLFHNKQENRIEVVNMEKARKQTRGLEPNRILQEIMGTPLRDVETQEQIDLLMEKIEKGDLESDETRELVETLKQNLGLKDPFIMRLEHRLRMLNFKKER